MEWDLSSAVVALLQGEKIDIVNWSEDPAILVSNALSPAEVQRVNVDLERKKLDVILTEDNLSKAIEEEVKTLDLQQNCWTMK